jgi:hypothetical protein
MIVTRHHEDEKKQSTIGDAGRHDRRGLGERGAMVVRRVEKDGECGGTRSWVTNNDDNIICSHPAWSPNTTIKL